jgi:hypothetical protein
MSSNSKSTTPSPADQRPKNKLLGCLPAEDFERIRPHLRTLPIKTKQVFHPLNEPIRDVIFPNGGVASVTAVMRDGSMVEVATVGDEGMVIQARNRPAWRLVRVRQSVLAGTDHVDDALNRMHGTPPRSGAVLPLAADDSRSRTAR